MEEHDKLSKLFMWSKIKELISDGLNFSQISRRLDLHRQTVAHYASMSYEEFVSSTSYQRGYAHKLDEYEEFVVALLRKYPFVSSAQVHDRLKEKYGDMPRVPDKTVFNFVRRLRLTHDVPKEEATAFFNLINTLHERTSIIVTTNKSPTEWAQTLEDEVLASAILDRLLFRCEIIKLSGESYRMCNRKTIFSD